MAWASLGQGLTLLQLGHRSGANLVDATTWRGTIGHQTFLLLSLVPDPLFTVPLLGMTFLVEQKATAGVGQIY